MIMIGIGSYFSFLLVPLPIGTDAKKYDATFTWYGSGDERGSPNCQTKTAACGWYTSPGVSAAVSENLYGVGPGAGSGPYCGKCLRLNIRGDKDGKPIKGTGRDVVVMVNNLCPASGNPLCAQGDMKTRNQYGGVVDINLCSDSGAKRALFGASAVGLAVGSAEEVDCEGNYNGTRTTESSSRSMPGMTGDSPRGGQIGNQAPDEGQFGEQSTGQGQLGSRPKLSAASLLLSRPSEIALLVALVFAILCW